jgi:CheY-like chemotaxis protein
MSERLLIVEDCGPIATVVAGHLAAAGYRTTIAPDGERALELVAEDAPDCILLDLMLPGMSGVDVFERLRADAATASIPIVLVSAQVDTVQPLSMAVEGAVGKPFTRAQLVDAVKKALAAKPTAAP